MKSLLVTCIISLFSLPALSQGSLTGFERAAVVSKEIDPALQGAWMYGNFSMKEYWSENPGTYLGNALQMAIAFKFNADGTYEQYFTSRSVTAGMITYQQSVTRGTVRIDEATRTIVTHAVSSHYKRTQNKRVIEERDMRPDELSSDTKYIYSTGEENGVKALYLQLGTSSPLKFLKKW